MNYKGDLYGKASGITFKLLHTSDQFDRMHEALKGIYELRSLIYYDPETTKAEHSDEALAVHNAMTQIESLLKELE